MFAAVRIVLLGVVAAIAYGVVHDNITARICVEYFTIGHAPIFHTDSPTRLALGWGVIATWWVGAILGVILAFACRAGTWPKLGAADLLRPLGVLLASMAACATLAGCVGHYAAGQRWVWLEGWIADAVPAAKHRAFLTDLWAHLASYASAAVGGLILAGWAIARRHRLARKPPPLDPLS